MLPNVDFAGLNGMRVITHSVYGLAFAVWATRLSHTLGSEPPYNVEQDVRKYIISEDDRRLLTKLVKAGSSHSKFLRFITAYMAITAPRYWWSQFDTYKVGVSVLSESTMHTIMKRKLTDRDFVIPVPNLNLINQAISDGDFEYVKAILPEGFLQTRGVCTNYQALRTMYHQRLHHRLAEWTLFCRSLEILPESYLITTRGN